MSSINSVRIPGLATGMDTDQMIKDMLAADQSKIDKVKQNQQLSKWKQETYRDIIKDIKGFYDKYFTTSSNDYILGNKSFNTLTINSTNNSVISATGSAGANNINYNFKVNQLATPPTFSTSTSTNKVIIKKDTKLSDLGLSGEKNFKIDIGKDKQSKVITIDENDTVESLINKINDSMPGEIKASFSDMTGQLTIKSSSTGENSTLKIIDVEKDADNNFIDKSTSDSLSFLGFKDSDGNAVVNGEVKGKNAKVEVRDSSGKFIKELNEQTNSFNIDGVIYSVNGIGEATLTSTQNVSYVVDKMETFINDYNKIIDNIYDLITERKSREYAPLTEAQKEEMSEKEIEKWENKAKEGMLKNDSDLRAFMDDIRSAIFSPIESMGVNLADIGITSAKDYNKQGQIEIDVEKFTKALQENGDLAQKITTGSFEKVKDVMYKYAGSSSGILVKKAGMDNSSTEINNIFSEQIRKQEEQVKTLMNKMKKKEQQLYSKFARLESTMSRLNAQMSYLNQ